MERAELKNLVVIGLLILAVAFVGWNGLAMIGWRGVAGLRADAAKLQADRTKLETSVTPAGSVSVTTTSVAVAVIFVSGFRLTFT